MNSNNIEWLPIVLQRLNNRSLVAMSGSDGDNNQNGPTPAKGLVGFQNGEIE